MYVVNFVVSSVLLNQNANINNSDLFIFMILRSMDHKLMASKMILNSIVTLVLFLCTTLSHKARF